MKRQANDALQKRRPIIGLPPNRRSATIVLLLLASGAGLTAWGIRGGPIAVRATRPVFVAQSATPPLSTELRATVQRGALLQQLSCGGCHAASERLVGPSYLEIANHYRDEPNRQAALAAAALHPSPGFANYPPGPVTASIPTADREAIAGWILDLPNEAK